MCDINTEFRVIWTTSIVEPLSALSEERKHSRLQVKHGQTTALAPNEVR